MDQRTCNSILRIEKYTVFVKISRFEVRIESIKLLMDKMSKIVDHRVSHLALGRACWMSP